MLTTGSVIASKYRLEVMFAKGGMGSVWRARHLLLDTDLAIKLMDPSIAASPPERSRFAAEAKAAAKLKSRHIVQVHDYGVEEDSPYIVMELLEGEDLGARLRREGQLSFQVAADLLGQLARGLRKAHEMGVIHRDLKPANVFLARADDEEVVKILDFGIARFAARSTTSEMTRTGTLMGSPPYMSPEQVRGLRELDHRTDLWSVGVILYRCVTGVLPFQSEQLGDLIYKICSEPMPAPSSLSPNIPASLDRFFERALAKKPADRFQSIGEMADAFPAACGLLGRGPLLSLAESAPGGEAGRAAAAQPPPGATVVFPGHIANRTLPLDLGPAAPFAPSAPVRGTRTELSAPSPGALRSPESAPWTASAPAPLGGVGVPRPPESASWAASVAGAVAGAPRPPESWSGAVNPPVAAFSGGSATPQLAGNHPGTGTQIASPVNAGLVTPPPQNVALTMPFPDAGTLSAGGRTVRSGPATPSNQGLWWKMGLIGGAALVVAAVVISQVKGAVSPVEQGASSQAGPTPTALVVPPSEAPAPSAPSSAPPVMVTAEPDPSSTAETQPDPSGSAASVAVKKGEPTGKLTVNAIPVSKVVIDGRPMGSTPLVGMVVSAGRHRVTLVDARSNTRYSESVEVAPGGTAKVVHRF